MGKKILVLGKTSYIGESFIQWLAKYGDFYEVESVSSRNNEWKNISFNNYDVILHVAGIAHVSNDSKLEDMYYEVNTNLTLEVAKKAKNEGVKQFIFMSSMIVYGDRRKHQGPITVETIPAPSNPYGDSKLQAEKGLQALANNDFKVAIIRPPMIYGNGSKGNYPRLAKLAQKFPLFPNFDNKRSMLFIDNLSEFIKNIVDFQEEGTFFPQNKDHVKTSDMVLEISKIHKKKHYQTKMFNPLIKSLRRINTINKVFGDLYYESSISQYDFDYQNVSLTESIKLTEDSDIRKCKVLILVNHDLVIYNFRKELVEALVDLDYDVLISSPPGTRLEKLKQMGALIDESKVERHGKNPFQEITLLKYYYSLVKEFNPDVILTYTIKPNIYGGIIARLQKKPIIGNVTGLGNAMNGNKSNKILFKLYKFAFNKSKHIFFQNDQNLKYFTENVGLQDRYSLLPGSGVNVDEFQYLPYPDKPDDTINVLYFGRLMRSKGIFELFDSIEIMNNKKIKFQFVGFFDDVQLEEKYKNLEEGLNIELIPHQEDMKPFIRNSDVVILPSYHEGMSNALLEAAAIGRPLLASNIPGCREIIDDGINGFLFKPKDPNAIVEAISKFLLLSVDERIAMGYKSRDKVVNNFNRNIVVNQYLKKIEEIIGEL